MNKFMQLDLGMFFFYSILIATFGTFTYIFLTAYFNGYKTIVTINEQGEAHIEMLLLIISWGLLLYKGYPIFKLILENQKVKQ